MPTTPVLVIYAFIFAAFIAGMGGVYRKAGYSFWWCLMPVYNILLLLRIAGKPWWWFFGFVLPIVSLVVQVLSAFSLSERFGKPVVFALGVAFLPFIFLPIIALDNSEYRPEPQSRHHIA